MGLLRTELKGEEQRMFLEGFHLYMKHDSRKDFVVDMDDAYEWLGFTRKDNCERVIDNRYKSA